jgi:putative protease
MNKVELLAPAGDLDKLKVAITYGADAVFIGGKQFSLRAKASNFEIKDIAEGVAFAHAHNAKVFITVNIYPHNEDLNGLDEYLLALDEVGIDAILVSSPYIVQRCLDLKVKFEVHLSTQQSAANIKACEFWEEIGVKRIVLAREMDVDQIAELRKNSRLPIEVFIHGGSCSSFSGRCTLSNNMSNRDANRGGCSHSCRWGYDVFHEGVLLSNPETPFKFGSKDINAVMYIKQLLEAGIDSFKIEGRMKSVHYIASVVATYRELIDDIYENKGAASRGDFDYYNTKLKKAENREASEGFLKGDVDFDDILYHAESETPSQEFLGMILDYDAEKQMALIQVRNHFNDGIEASLVRPFSDDVEFKIEGLFDKDLNPVVVANKAMQELYLKVPAPVQKYAILRKR